MVNDTYWARDSSLRRDEGGKVKEPYATLQTFILAALLFESCPEARGHGKLGDGRLWNGWWAKGGREWDDEHGGTG